MSYDFPDPSEIFPEDDETEFFEPPFIQPDLTYIGGVTLSDDNTVFADVYYRGEANAFPSIDQISFAPISELLSQYTDAPDWDDVRPISGIPDEFGGKDMRAFGDYDDARMFKDTTGLGDEILWDAEHDIFYILVETP